MDCYRIKCGSDDIGTKFSFTFCGQGFDMFYGYAGNVAAMTAAKRHGEWR
jgi:hypothetical protein